MLCTSDGYIMYTLHINNAELKNYVMVLSTATKMA